MANLNKVMLIGRLTRDIEVRTFANGGQVANVGFACNNRKKNAQTGQWEDEPVFVDLTAWNKTAEAMAKYLRKGSQAFIEGKLVLEQWDDKQTGQKRQKLKVVVEECQFLDSKDSRPRQGQPEPSDAYEGTEAEWLTAPVGGQADNSIPF